MKWKIIEESRPYEVSEDGRVRRRLDWEEQIGRRVWCRRGGKAGDELKPQLNTSGYIYVGIAKVREDGVVLKRWRPFVHTLVARAFIGECPKGREVNHKDGDKRNNHWSNLEYLTHKENIRHAWDSGMMDGVRESLKGMWEKRRAEGWVASGETRMKMSEAKQGARHPRAKTFDIGEVLNRRGAGWTYAEIARDLGCSTAYVGKLFKKGNWKLEGEGYDMSVIRQIDEHGGELVRLRKQSTPPKLENDWSPAEKCGG